MRVTKRTDHRRTVPSGPGRSWRLAIFGALIGASLGALAAWPGSQATFIRLRSLVTTPSLMLRASRLGAGLPRLQMDV
ncbi:MAG: hypothetical protein MUQ30_17865, partial [Anaerolineae bacterium]|nr:hypothetical protein [Anaerolineae bacterium]